MAVRKVKNSEFTGRHMLILMVVFFGVIVAVNMFMMYKAVTTFRGEDIKQSYRQGLYYNKTLETRQQQLSRGWDADINLTGRMLTLRIVDQNGVAIRGLKIEAVLKHPVETDLDSVLTFLPNQKTGSYIATIPDDNNGKRHMHIKAFYANIGTQTDALFETKNEIWLK